MEHQFCGYFRGDDVCEMRAAYEVVEPDTKAVFGACLDHGNEIRAECEAGTAVGYIIRSLAAS